MIFFGTKTVQTPLPSERQVCPNCMSVTNHAVAENALRFTLYFIPVFTIRREVIYTCSQCGDSHVMLYDDYLAAHASQPPAPAEEQVTGPAAPAAPKGAVTLEGRVVGDEIRTRRPLSAHVNADTGLKALYVFFALLGIAAVLLFAALLLFSSYR